MKTEVFLVRVKEHRLHSSSCRRRRGTGTRLNREAVHRDLVREDSGRHAFIVAVEEGRRDF